MNHVQPRLEIERVQVRAANKMQGEWQVSWVVRNQSGEALALESAWIPHGRFRGTGRLPLDVQLAPGESTLLSCQVAAAEAPGTVVENAFLILRCRYGGRAWQVFVRMRIEFDAPAQPQPVVETITTQSLE